MPYHPEAAADLAPDDFWEELRDFHNVLWKTTPRLGSHRLSFLTVHARQAWAHSEDGELETPLAIATRWHVRKRIGGTALTTMNITIMRLEDVDGMGGRGKIAESDAPVENMHVAYSLPASYSQERPVLVAHTRMYTPREVMQTPPLPNDGDGMLVELQLARHGLITPESVDYDRILQELAVGATGQFRAPLE